MIDDLTKGKFAGELNGRFTIRVETPEATADEVALELIEVTGDERLRAHGMDNFSLVFRGPNERPLPQMTYRLRNDSLGEFDLFVVPVRRDVEGVYYEAVFNRMLK
jgi:hypothetical protein